jgi:glycosyltransferase involved in cell wall biosynthesis
MHESNQAFNEDPPASRRPAVVSMPRPATGLRIVRYYPRAATGDGGMTGAVARWSNAVSELGSTVTIVHDGGAPPRDRGPAEWRDLSHRGGGRGRLPVRLGDALRDADVLVLHSAWTAHGLRAGSVARKLGVPYILEPRGAYDPHIVRRKSPAKRLWWLAGERRLVQRAAAVHLFFEEERPAYAELGYHGPFIVVPNGTAVTSDRPWTGGGGYLLFLGRFDVEHKGLDLLIEAVTSLPAPERPQVRLHGSDHHGGGGITAVRRLIDRSGVGDWVTVNPRISGEEKLAALAACDGFVYPSRWDACPNAVLEAVGLGVPTLATPYPLARDLERRGAAVVAEATPSGLADGLRRLTSASLKRELAARGPDVVATEYAWPRVAASWLAQVVDVLGTRASRHS